MVWDLGEHNAIVDSFNFSALFSRCWRIKNKYTAFSKTLMELKLTF
jgi:hypothetical protein